MGAPQPSPASYPAAASTGVEASPLGCIWSHASKPWGKIQLSERCQPASTWNFYAGRPRWWLMGWFMVFWFTGCPLINGPQGLRIESVGRFLKAQFFLNMKREVDWWVSWWSYDWWLNVSKICLEGFEANLVGVYPHGPYLHQDIWSNPWVWNEGLCCQIPVWFAYLKVISSNKSFNHDLTPKR